MRKLLVIGVMLMALVCTSLSIPQPASAAVAEGCSSSFLSFPAWYKYLDVGPKDGDECAITGPDKEGSDEFDLIAALPLVGLAIIEILTRLAALISVAFVMYGGFRYITSQGEPENTKSARQTIINSLIGLSLSLIATGLVAFLAYELTT